MATWRDWTKIKIQGRTLVSNFSSLGCTDKHYAEYTTEQLVEPAQVLSSFGADYYSVNLDHFEEGDVFMRVAGKIIRLNPDYESRRSAH